MNTLLAPISPRAAATLACVSLALLGPVRDAAAQMRRVSLTTGTVIPVRLDQKLSSKVNQVGDRFTVTVRYGDDDADLPEGSQIRGVVVGVERSQNGKPGTLDLDFRWMTTPGGQSHSLDGSLIALNGKDVKATDSGQLVASRDAGKDRLKLIGIGAGGGLLIGKLTKSNAIWSTVLGAGAGYLYNDFANRPKPGDVVLNRGAEFGIRLDRPMNFTTNRRDGDATRTAREDDADERAAARYADAQRAEARERSASEARGDEIGMMIDNNDVDFESARPVLRNGRVLVPLDAVARAADFDYTYDKANRMIRARRGQVRLPLSSNIARMAGRRYRMSGISEMRDGTLYVPLEFVGLAADATVLWESDSRTVILTRNRAR